MRPGAGRGNGAVEHRHYVDCRRWRARWARNRRFPAISVSVDLASPDHDTREARDSCSMSVGDLRAPDVRVPPRREHAVALPAQAPRVVVDVQERVDEFAKRMIDLSIASVVLLLCLPVLVLVALAVRLDSPGPAFFRQTRLGRDGRRFTIYKCRTMAVHNDEREHAAYVAELAEGRAPTHGGLYKLVDDPRSTALGRFLRVSSFDEVPQLVNVLKGDMSLVGPRPSTPEDAASWDPQAWQRLAVRPGLTGPWQISGRSRLSFDEMIALDLDYASTWSPWGDVVVLAHTPAALLRRETA
jgi:lipopolysaccharide/colanic/teichoic acid biosynthesis glycosyltransferase